jgi:hypothetical protein
MRFLADESYDFAVVRALRAAGHDVQAVSEACPGTPDELIMQLAVLWCSLAGYGFPGA